MADPRLELGRYALVRRIARDGMVTVYLGRTVGAGRSRKPVLVKVIHPHLMEHDAARAAFVREAKLAARLVHPNIVQVLDFGEEDGRCLMALEYVHGFDLRVITRYLAETGRSLSVEHALYIAHEVLRALQFAHDAADERGIPLGIVHRDVNPENVLVSQDGQVKLGDFGVARVREEIARTSHHEIAGVLAYLSPEQVEGGTVDERSDIFSTAVLLWELLTGTRLFQGDSDAAIVRAVHRAEVSSLLELRPSLPPALQTILEKALRRDPEERHPTAESFASDLREVLGRVPPAAIEPSFRRMIRELAEEPAFEEHRERLPDPATSMDVEPIVESGEPPAAASAAGRGSPSPSPTVSRRGRAAILTVVFVVVAVATALALTAWLRWGAAGRGVDSGAAEGRGAVAPAAAVTAAVLSQRGELGRCYRRYGEALGPTSMTLVLRVGAEGRATEVRIEPPALDREPLGRCVAEVARRARYPREAAAAEPWRVPIAMRPR